MSQQAYSYKQTTISSFFAPCKGPLAFQMPSFKSPPKQKEKKRRRSKKLKREKYDEEQEDDVEIIEEIEEKVDIDKEETRNQNISTPLSPQITFDGNLILVDDDKVSTEAKSTQLSTVRNDKLLESPSKRLKLSFTQDENCSRLINIAITKSTCESKNEDKPSKTQMMNSSSKAMINYTIDETDNTEKIYVASLRTIIGIDEENEESQMDNLDDVIPNHLAKVKKIIKNSIRPNFENLLLEDDHKLLISFCSLRTVHQFICCKLFTHKIKWYNPVSFIENLRNCELTADIVKVDETLRILEENNFILTDYRNEELSYLLNLLKMDDIRKICKDLRIKGKLQRDKNLHIDAILVHISKQPTLNPSKPMVNVVKNMVCNMLGTMFKISESFYNTFYKIHLLYSFTNPELDIPQGVYKFMGEILYNSNIIPKYKIRDDIIFETAEEFSAFYKAYSYKEELLQEAGKKNSDKEIMLKLCDEIFAEFKLIINQHDIQKYTKPSFLNRFTPGWKYASALVFGIDKLSAKFPAKSKLWLEVLLNQKYFRIRKRSLLYAQLATIYKKHFKDIQTACEILANGLKDDDLLFSDVCELIYRCKNYMKKGGNSQYFKDVLDLLKEAPDVKKFPSNVIVGISDSEEPVYKYVNIHGDTEYLRVEDYAIKHYTDMKGFHQGVHCEGSIMNTLFYIFFWDIIYMDGIEKTFISPIQRNPLDLHHGDFYTTRQQDIDKRVVNIKSEWSMEELINFINEICAEASKCKAVILSLDVDRIIHIVTVLTRRITADICEKFAKQYDECSAGLPDLFLWNDTKCKFVEVKGPGDQLSTKQTLWIQFLLKIGADVEVCHVRRMGGRQ